MNKDNEQREISPKGILMNIDPKSETQKPDFQKDAEAYSLQSSIREYRANRERHFLAGANHAYEAMKKRIDTADWYLAELNKHIDELTKRNEYAQSENQRLQKINEELVSALIYAEGYLSKGGFGRFHCHNVVREALEKHNTKPLNHEQS